MVDRRRSTEWPLGYGPSSADPESGQIISGSAYIYGGLLTAIPSATDLVRAVNGDLCAEFGLDDGDVSCAIQGEDFKQWINDGAYSMSADRELSDSFKRSLSQRLGFSLDSQLGGDSPADIAKAMRHLKRRFSHANPQDRLMDKATRVATVVDEWIAQLKQEPMMRARLVTTEIVRVLNPLRS